MNTTMKTMPRYVSEFHPLRNCIVSTFQIIFIVSVHCL
uniref:Uncharacterized protein n=1 Tax=Arundo donax TaxID=35708 RepID=A0A0A9EJI6_ARUDO